jgi:lactobin A/cerein 7B family class IIb bacteriocin
MKTNNLLTVELSKEELSNTNGGIVLTLSLLGGLAVSTLCAGIIIIPIAAAAYKGWNDYSN